MSREKPPTPRHGIARALSKLGVASRTEAARWVMEGRVRVNGRVIRDPEFPTRAGRDRITVNGVQPAAPVHRAIMLNKPRGLVTTTRDEKGRNTVYDCLTDADLPWLAPIGRLDKASEGLLLFTNDPVWAARITDPTGDVPKTYHVQIGGLVDTSLPERMLTGVVVEGEHLRAVEALYLRGGVRNSWLEIVLHEGRNRHIRRLLAALGIRVLRLVRVSIGGLPLGDLAKGAWRELNAADIHSIGVGTPSGAKPPINPPDDAPNDAWPAPSRRR